MALNATAKKEKDISVFFETENINTLDTTGEVLLTILSSLAQDDSRKLSENTKWGIARQWFDEIVQTINSRDSLLEEFDEEIFNALVEKIEILTPTHFVFELKSGMRVEEIEE